MKQYIIPILAGLLLMGTAACNKADKFNYGKEIVLVTGTDASPISSDRILADQVPISYNYSISATGVAKEDLVVHVQYDTVALKAYNKANRTNYVSVPREMFLIDDEYVTIKKGTAVSPTTSVTMLNNDFIEEGVNYVIPLSVAYTEGETGKEIPDGSKSFFIKVGKTMETYSLDITNTAPYSTFYLGNNETGGYELDKWTLEIKAYPYNLKHSGADQLCRLCCWNEDDGGQVLLRFNENGKPWKSLDIVAPSGRYVTAKVGDNGTFEENTWYMISMVWDGSNFTVYINGVKDVPPSENTVSGNQGFKLNRFEIGMSWGGYGGAQSYTGRMAEMRIWNIARSQSDIASTLCSVDATAEGLQGYWKMNEGEGHVFHDSVAGNDMDWDKSERQKDEKNYVTTPEAGAAISWVKDEKNKCAQ